jgi:SAM-dependent methyltransferase
LEMKEPIQCPLCGQSPEGKIRDHLLTVHGEEELSRAVISDKEKGLSDVEIGRRYGLSFGALQRMITRACGANIGDLRPAARIRRWQPSDFRLETTTVWSFKERGRWATHDGRYRGNWSPYIPRNIILRYSRPGDLILDYFVGGGTTAVEAKLLGRRCIARDINPAAVSLTRRNLGFSPPAPITGEEIYEPMVEVGDARDLSGISDNSVDLICAHPPYARIIRYSSGLPGDLSALTVPEFLQQMRKVARESLRVLKPGGKCAILVGDARQSKRVVPVGFMVIRVFLDVGFRLKELIIKRQHNCRATGFWYSRSVQYNFLLLAHEYLPVFEKPAGSGVQEQLSLWEASMSCRTVQGAVWPAREEPLEAMTVWVFPLARMEEEVRRNLFQRFAEGAGELVEIHLTGDGGISEAAPLSVGPANLWWIRLPEEMDEAIFAGCRRCIGDLLRQAILRLPPDGYLVIEAKDFRSPRGDLVPAALLLWEDLGRERHLALKEIVIVVPEETPPVSGGTHLAVIHKYLLIYVRESV